MPEIQSLTKKVDTVRELLNRSKAQFALALPRHVSADRLLRVAMTAIQLNPKLIDCTQHSLLASLMEAAQMGLMPDPITGEAYLVPYNIKGQATCRLIPGYKGLAKLARRSGEIQSLEMRHVNKCDHFVYEYGLNPKLEHMPHRTPDCTCTTELLEAAQGEHQKGCPNGGHQHGPLTHVYAIARLKDGGVQWLVMEKAEVDKIRARSMAANAGPWVTDYAAMAKKTVLKQTLKLCPIETELARALENDDRRDVGLPDLPVDMPEGATPVVVEGRIVAKEEDDPPRGGPPTPNAEGPKPVNEVGPCACEFALASLKRKPVGTIVVCTDCGKEHHRLPDGPAQGTLS